MDDVRCREFFVHPSNTYHRRYEALRAVFVEGRRQKDVAERFELRPDTLRHLVCEFRERCRQPSEASPFFASPASADQERGQRRAGRGKQRTRSPRSRIGRS